jgi:hypothetical protein
MDSYDSRRITLDPGLTALALRGLHSRDGHYPFLERHSQGRMLRISWEGIRRRVATSFPTISALFASRPTLG